MVGNGVRNLKLCLASPPSIGLGLRLTDKDPAPTIQTCIWYFDRPICEISVGVAQTPQASKPRSEDARYTRLSTPRQSCFRGRVYAPPAENRRRSIARRSRRTSRLAVGVEGAAGWGWGYTRYPKRCSCADLRLPRVKSRWLIGRRLIYCPTHDSSSNKCSRLLRCGVYWRGCPQGRP
jgi:hypothetical protein